MPLALKEQDPESDELNPGNNWDKELHRQETASSDTDMAEFENEFDNDPDKKPGAKDMSEYEKDSSSSDDVKSKEQGASGAWLNNVTAADKKLLNKGVGTIAKMGLKKAALPAVAIFLVFGLFAIVMLFVSGSSLLVTVAQKAVEQTMNATPSIVMLRSMQLQHERLSTTKDFAVSGYCGNVVSIRCRFSTFSDTDIKAMEREGVKVTTKKGTMWDKLRGRKAIESVEVDGKAYDAKGLASAIKAGDGHVVARMTAASAPRWKTFTKNAFYRVLNKFGGTKLANIKSAQDRVTLEKELIDRVSGKQGAIDRLGLVENKDANGKTTGYTDPATGKTYAIGDPALDALLKSDASYAKIQEIREKIKAAGDKVSNFAAKNSVKAVAVGVGMIQIGCSAWNIVRNAEAITAQAGMQNMMSYSMVFLNQASMVRAGDGQGDVSSFLGDTLMTPNSAGMTGPDSRAGKQLFFGEQSPLPVTTFADPKNPTAAEQQQAELNSEITDYTAGATMGPDLLQSIVKGAGVSPSDPGWVKSTDKICGILNSPLVGGLMLGAGITVTAACFASAVIPVLGEATVGGCAIDLASQFGMMAVIWGVLAGLQHILNMVSGTMITGNENGPQAMAAFVTGTEGIGYLTGTNNGLSLATKAESDAFQANVVKPANLAYANIDREHYAWYDASNTNTVMGSIVSSLYPSFSSISAARNVPQLFGAFGSILATPMKALSPQANAQIASKECASTMYASYATSQNCTPLAATSDRVLKKGGMQAVDYLIGTNQLDEDGHIIGSKIIDYIKNCTTERKVAFGAVEEGQPFNDVNTGAICATDYNGPDAETYRNVQAYMQYAAATSDVDVLQDYKNTTSGTAASSTSGISLPSKDGWSNPTANKNISFDWHATNSNGQLHKGVDFPGPQGTEVYAAHDGKVTLSYQMGGGCGWATVIQPTGVNGIYFAYQHMDPLVKVGDTVTRGQVIGHIGTFCGTGYHVHFSIETANRVSTYADTGASDTSLDPKGYLPL